MVGACTSSPMHVPWGYAEADVSPSRVPALEQRAAFPVINGENCVSHSRRLLLQSSMDRISCNGSLQCLAEKKLTEN